MITKLSHATVWVLDQDSAYDFYVNKLGFEVRTDAPMGPDFRWLTVGPKTQPDLEIILMKIEPGMALNEESAEKLRSLVRSGQLGAGVFDVDDIYSTYEELMAKGVMFRSAPEEQFYGIECIMQDDSGNWWSVTQRKN